MTHRIALIPGDGIGIPVTEAALRVMEASGADITTKSFPWSCDHYLQHGRMMPEDGIETLRGFDAIFLGAVGWPARVPDAVSLHGLLLPIRKAFVQYANIRPHRLLPGVEGPLKTRDFDILCIRENTEGEYSGAGGRVHQGTPDEVAVETSIFTRAGVERILRFGFEQARARRGKLASVTKSNAQRHSMVFWDEVTEELAAEYPDVAVTRYHIDAMCARMDHGAREPGRGGRLEPLRRHPDRSGRGHPGRPGLRGLGQHRPDAPQPLDIRTGPRLAPRHRGSGHRQPDGGVLVGGDDAGPPGPDGPAARIMAALEAATAPRHRHPPRAATPPTPSPRPFWRSCRDRTDPRSPSVSTDQARRPASADRCVGRCRYQRHTKILTSRREFLGHSRGY